MIGLAGVDGQVKIGVALDGLSKVPLAAVQVKLGVTVPADAVTDSAIGLLNCSLTEPDCENPNVGLLTVQLTVLIVTPGAICNIRPILPADSPLPGLPLSFIEHDPANASPNATPATATERVRALMSYP